MCVAGLPGHAGRHTCSRPLQRLPKRLVLDPLLRGEYPADLWALWPGCEPLVLTDDMATIAQPLDYLGLNYYSRAVVRSTGPDSFTWVHPEGVERTTMDWRSTPGPAGHPGAVQARLRQAAAARHHGERLRQPG